MVTSVTPGGASATGIVNEFGNGEEGGGMDPSLRREAAGDAPWWWGLSLQAMAQRFVALIAGRHYNRAVEKQLYQNFSRQAIFFVLMSEIRLVLRHRNQFPKHLRNFQKLEAR